MSCQPRPARCLLLRLDDPCGGDLSQTWRHTSHRWRARIPLWRVASGDALAAGRGAGIRVVGCRIAPAVVVGRRSRGYASGQMNSSSCPALAGIWESMAGCPQPLPDHHRATGANSSGSVVANVTGAAPSTTRLNAKV